MNKSELLKIAKPILFNTEMVRAILDGRKTVTRRVIKPQPKSKICYCFAGYRAGKWGYPSKDVHKYWGEEFKRTEQLTAEEENRYWTPPCHTDDIRYVRETWLPCNIISPEKYLYKADYDLSIYPYCNWTWHPSIHMPKEAARIFLRVTNVRAERLQDITCSGMEKEGIIPRTVTGGQWQQWQNDYMKPVWDSTIKKSDLAAYGWDANPWVWVIEFERVM